MFEKIRQLQKENEYLTAGTVDTSLSLTIELLPA
jgi:hypothetical protein